MIFHTFTFVYTLSHAENGIALHDSVTDYNVTHPSKLECIIIM